MMYYHRRPPERRAREYFMPFFMIIMLAVIAVFGWRILNSLLVRDNQSTTNERVFLTIEGGNVEAMAADSTQWQGVPDKIYLYRGEKLKTGGDGRATLTFWNESLIRLNHESELRLQTLKRQAETDAVEAELTKGNVWVNVKAMANADSSFLLNTPLLSVNTREGVYAISDPGTVYMIDGSATINVKKDGETLRSYTLGVGQQFVVDEEMITKLAGQESPELIFAIADAFKESDWYRWNRDKEGVMADFGVDKTPTTDVMTGTETETGTTENPTATDLATPPVTSPSSVATGDDPAAPVITEPGKNGETVTLNNTEAIITGTVSADTAAVIADDYQLQQYQAGSRAFRYVAKVSYGNLKVGENKFKIYAKNAAGDLSEPATITLVLTQAVLDAHPETQAESSPSASSPQSTGGVRITAPNNGEDFTTSETKFDISGVVPATTAKVVVNDYALSRYEPGSTHWTYRAYSSMGSLKIGQKNAYVVIAYDAEDKELGRDSITIDVESQGAPEIIIPTNRTSYMTNLDELVIGGTVGKWVQEVVVNDEKLLNYIPGSEKWNRT
ncbi:MAG: FecR domain-containing protein, partial [Candidatus Peregrinibacteria bacterium]